MERCFIVSKDSELNKAFEKYKARAEEQRKFVNEFMTEKGIHAKQFIVSGDGFVNTHFEEHNKSNIMLSIKPTENDIEKFGKMLKNPSRNHGLCAFKKNTAIAKEFAQKCVDRKIVINLWKPLIGDYFKSLGYMGCSWHYFGHDDVFYLKIESEHLNKDEIPEGLSEIKLSEYYTAKEAFEAKH